MAIEKFEADLNIVQKLDDEPNDVGGMSSAELKETFDRSGNLIKEFINDKLIPAIDENTGKSHEHQNKALLDTYTQTEEKLADAVSKTHEHENKELLDSYTQTEEKLADAVSKTHEHPNKELLDSYTQTEENLADAVSKKHGHGNKALLDTYQQTETDLKDAVDKKHVHLNQKLLDTYDQTNENLKSAVEKTHGHENKTVLDAIKGLTQTLGTAADKVPSEAAVAEAIKKGGGSGSADMAVNDPDEAGYVKNRTHWKEIIQEAATVMEDVSVTFANELSSVSGMGTETVVVDGIYDVKWNGTNYTCIAFMGTNESVLLGNPALNSLGDDTGEPFLFEMATATTAFVTKSTSGAETVTLSIAAKETIIWHKLDPRYMEDMYYTEKGNLVELVPEATITFNSDGQAITMDVVSAEVGGTYTVKWKGTEYVCVGQLFEGDGMALGVALGDLGLVMGGVSTGEPFVIVFTDPSRVDALGVGSTIVALDGSATATVSVTGGGGDIVHKLDNKYLDLAWLPIVDSTQVEIYSGEAVKNTAYLAVDTSWVSAVSKLSAAIDGVMYGPARVQVIDGVLTCFGNANLINSGYPVSSYPFVLVVDSSDQAVIAFEDGAAHDLVLYKADGAYNRMPHQFLPEGTTTELTAETNDKVEGTVAAIDSYLKNGRRAMCTRNSKHWAEVFHSYHDDAGFCTATWMDGTGLRLYSQAAERDTGSPDLSAAMFHTPARTADITGKILRVRTQQDNNGEIHFELVDPDTVPTKTSELTNDAGFVVSGDVTKNVSLGSGLKRDENGAITLDGDAQNIILTSSNGTKFKLSVSNDGALTATEVTS